jgi:hypothetical protein
MGKRSRSARAPHGPAAIPADTGDTGEMAFPRSRLPDTTFAEKEAMWEHAVGNLELALRLAAYSKDDPRHIVEVETWWRNTVLLRAAKPAQQTEGTEA